MTDEPVIIDTHPEPESRMLGGWMSLAMVVGGMVEQRILSDLRTSYDEGTSFTNEFIAKHGL